MGRILGVVGEDMVVEIKRIISHGLAESFDGVPRLRQLRAVTREIRGMSKTEGIVILQRVLADALQSWELDSYRRSMGALFAFDTAGRHNRALNGPRGLRQQAAAPFGVGFDRFKREWELKVIESFVEWLLVRDEMLSEVTSGPVRVITWAEFERVCQRLHRDIERVFNADLIVTMPGPGSFAACYFAKLSARDIPVVMCVTFPMRTEASYPESDFGRAASEVSWPVFETERWRVFLPDVLYHYPSGSRVLLLDDRVITGETERDLESALAERGLQVRSAALFAPPKSPGISLPMK